MVCASVLELCGSNINNSFSCTVGDQMNEAKQILTGISKAHATADTGLIIGSGT